MVRDNQEGPPVYINISKCIKTDVLLESEIDKSTENIFYCAMILYAKFAFILQLLLSSCLYKIINTHCSPVAPYSLYVHPTLWEVTENCCKMTGLHQPIRLTDL